MTVRVLHLIKGLGPGGAEQLLVSQARATNPDDATFEVAYLVPWKSHLVPNLEAFGWTVHLLGSGRSIDLRWAGRLRRLLRRERFDVVHGHSPLVAAIARIVLRTVPASERPKSVYTEHNEWGRHRTLTRLLNRATLSREDDIIAVSEAVRSSMATSAPVDVLEHGIDVDAVAAHRSQRHQVRAELGFSNDDVVIGIVANFRPEKAYDVLVDAAARVIEKDPAVRFVSVGQGPLENEIRQLVRARDLDDRFTILGYRDDAPRVMSAFDIFTLSSRHEGLPVSLMEAMALQLPVVATTVGGIAAATTGWPAELVAPDDAAALAAAYHRMVEHLPVDVSDSKHRRFDARHSASSLVERYRQVASA